MSPSSRIVASVLFVAVLVLGVWGLRPLSEPAPNAPPVADLTQEATRGTEEDPQARLNFERRRLRNPSTGQIHANARKRELAFADRMPGRLQKSAADSWQPRGPANVG